MSTTTASSPRGKVQRLILDELAAAEERMGPGRGYVLSHVIAHKLRAIDLGLGANDELPPHEYPSRADSVSVCRAARELARRGLVSIDKRPESWTYRDRSAVLWIAPPGEIVDERRRGLAEKVSRRVVEILDEVRQGTREAHSGQDAPPGSVAYAWLRLCLRRDAGDRCGEWGVCKAVERGIDKAEERGDIVVFREHVRRSTGWSRHPVRLFVALSDTTRTRQQMGNANHKWGKA